MSVSIKVSELRKMVEELEKDEIEYVEIKEFGEEIYEGETMPKRLCFEAFNGYGGGVNFGTIDHIDVNVDYKYKEEETTSN